MSLEFFCDGKSENLLIWGAFFCCFFPLASERTAVFCVSNAVLPPAAVLQERGERVRETLWEEAGGGRECVCSGEEGGEVVESVVEGVEGAGNQ